MCCVITVCMMDVQMSSFFAALHTDMFNAFCVFVKPRENLIDTSLIA